MATHSQLSSMKKDFEESNIFGINLPKLIHFISLIRSRNLNFSPHDPKKFTKDFIGIMCPLIDFINHSFDPNCKIEGQYLPVEGESIVIVRSVRPIEKGEELTINYGDYGNSDLLMKFGFLAKNNPFNELRVELNYDGFLQFTDQQFELKRKILRTHDNINLEEIGLFSNRINEDILKVLRIYFLTNEDIYQNTLIGSYLFRDFKNQVSKENESRICDFMMQTLNQILQTYLQNKEKWVDYADLGFKSLDEITLQSLATKEIEKNTKDMLQFCLEEEELLKKNLEFFTKKRNFLK